MSRIGNKFILIPDCVSVIYNDSILHISGKNGDVNYNIHESVNVILEKNMLKFENKNNVKNDALLGTTRSIVNSIILGVNNYFEKKLSLKGVGYKVEIVKKDNNINVLKMFLGFSHTVEYVIPNNVNVKVNDNTEITIVGICKQSVGQVAANIRFKKRPESYKIKGIYYSDEKVVLKETKKK